MLDNNNFRSLYQFVMYDSEYCRFTEISHINGILIYGYGDILDGMFEINRSYTIHNLDIKQTKIIDYDVITDDYIIKYDEYRSMIFRNTYTFYEGKPVHYFEVLLSYESQPPKPNNFL